MKKLVLAALAAFGIATTASADAFDTNLLKTTLVTDNLQFSLEGSVGSGFDTIGDAWVFEAGGYFFEHEVGTFDGVAYFYGQFGDVGNNEFGALGAKYILVQDFDVAAVELSAAADYVMFDDFGNGDFLITPRARVGGEVTDTVGLFGELDYSWNASNDFNSLGGYVEGGVGLGLTNSTDLLMSVVQPFDTGLEDDTFARVELVFEF